MYTSFAPRIYSNSVTPNEFGGKDNRRFIPITTDGLANQEAATRERPTPENRRLEDAVAQAYEETHFPDKNNKN
jgi:hypothetical protein